MINKILVLAPDAIPGEDFILQDNIDGLGPFIAFWDEEKIGRIMPERAELESITPAQIDNLKLILWRRSVIVSRYQMAMAMNKAGILDTVKTLIASAPVATRLVWSEKTYFRRLGKLATALANIIPLTESQLDQLFKVAEQEEP